MDEMPRSSMKEMCQGESSSVSILKVLLSVMFIVVKFAWLSERQLDGTSAGNWWREWEERGGRVRL